MAQQLVGVRPRFAHAKGNTLVVHSINGAYVFTAGTDRLLRRFATSKDEADSNAHTVDHTDDVTCLTVARHFLILGTEDRSVVRLQCPSLEFDNLLARCHLPINDVSISHDERYVAVATDDTSILIIHLDGSAEPTKLSGHSAPVRCVRFGRKSTSLLSVDLKGDVRVWHQIDGNFTCVKHLPGAVASKAVEITGYHQVVSWSNDDVVFAMVGASGIILVHTGSWQQSLRQNEHLKTIIGVEWSSYGYIVAYDTDGIMAVWKDDQTDSEAISSFRHTLPITCISWHPHNGSLVLADSNGRLVYCHDFVEPKIPQTSISDDEDIDGNMMMDSEDVLDDMDEDMPSVAATSSRRVSTDRSERRTIDEPKAPVFLQPGTTPWIGGKRYLAFDMRGFIISTLQDDHAIIRVEFHDTSSARGFHFTDHRALSLASLGLRGCIFANEPSEEQPAIIYYRPYNSVLSGGEWVKILPEGIHVISVALCGNVAVACLSNGFVHVFTSAGLERDIFALPNVISCAASTEHVLFICNTHGRYHYTLLYLPDMKFLQQGDLPNVSHHQPKWIGFSENKVPAFMDTSDTLYILGHYSEQGQARWIPVFQRSDTRGERLSYFPVGLTESQFSCVLCPGVNRYPGFSRPVISEFELRMPILQWDSGEIEQEERLLRMRTLAFTEMDTIDNTVSMQRQVAMDKLILSMIQLACKGEKVQRALELCSMLNLPAAYDAAAKIANFHHMSHLYERIILLKEALLEKQAKLFSTSEPRESPDPRAASSATSIVQQPSQPDVPNNKVDLASLLRRDMYDANKTSTKRGATSDHVSANKRQTTLKDHNSDH